MTRMLASVTGVEEAEIALSGGVDIVDLKDPAAGALGAVATDAVRRTVAFVAGRAETSGFDKNLGVDASPARLALGERWQPVLDQPASALLQPIASLAAPRAPPA